MDDTKKPYHLCGCLYAASEEAALVLQEIVRMLGGRGFTVKHLELQEDGVEITRTIA